MVNVKGFTLSVFAYIGFALPVFSQPQVIDHIVAVVNGQPITLSALENQAVIDGVENPTSEKKRAILEKLIDRKLLLQEAERTGTPLARWEDKIEAEVQAIQSKYPSEAAFRDDLKASGLEYEDVVESIKEGLFIQDLMARQFRGKLDMAEIAQEAAQYFEQHKSEFIEPTQVKFQYIMVLAGTEGVEAAKELADRIWAQLNADTTFDAIQQAYKNNQRVVVETTPEVRAVTTEVDAAIVKLDANGVSDPIHVPNGYLIAQLLEKKLPRQPDFPEVSQRLQERLIEEKLNAALEAWLKERRANGDIRILDEALAKTEAVREGGRLY